MSQAPRTQPSSPWLLRRSDQVVVAAVAIAGMAALVGWWVWRGGMAGRLVELDQAEPHTAGFEVDLNQADWAELAQLPGIGEALARRIVESRQAEGPFLCHDDLVRIHGIGPKTLEKLRPYLRQIMSQPTPQEAGAAGP